MRQETDFGDVLVQVDLFQQDFLKGLAVGQPPARQPTVSEIEMYFMVDGQLLVDYYFCIKRLLFL